MATIDTIHAEWNLVRSSESTDTGYASRVPQTAEPTGAGVVQFGYSGPGAPGAVASRGILLLPFATAADGANFNIRVLGWRRVPASAFGTGGLNLWIPVLLCEAAVRVSNQLPGLANTAVGSADLMANAITITRGDGRVYAPSDSQAAMLLVPSLGSAYLEILFNRGEALSAGSLYARTSESPLVMQGSNLSGTGSLAATAASVAAPGVEGRLDRLTELMFSLIAQVYVLTEVAGEGLNVPSADRDSLRTDPGLLALVGDNL
jgi:hypothetical protein